MNETRQHQDFVRRVVDFISTLVDPYFIDAIKNDLEDDNKPDYVYWKEKQQKYRPDVSFRYDTTYIIGEAKTAKDVFTEHSCAQYATYLRSLNLFKGLKKALVLCVPWDYVNMAADYLRQIKDKHKFNVEIYVIYNTGKPVTV